MSRSCALTRPYLGPPLALGTYDLSDRGGDQWSRGWWTGLHRGSTAWARGRHHHRRRCHHCHLPRRRSCTRRTTPHPPPLNPCWMDLNLCDSVSHSVLCSHPFPKLEFPKLDSSNHRLRRDHREMCSLSCTWFILRCDKTRQDLPPGSWQWNWVLFSDMVMTRFFLQGSVLDLSHSVWCVSSGGFSCGVSNGVWGIGTW
jgi:hypothetical protein